MRRTIVLPAMLGMFVLGSFSARWMPGANAADAGNSARIVNVLKMTDEELGAERPGTHMRASTFFTAPGATVSVQTGDVAKHFHQNSDEIQYIVEGHGTFWLGDHEQEVGPGDLIIIPKGTAHAGSHATTQRFKAISIKTPPQAADDVHPVS
jgi:mannose-6-phosphate isomerase-like protein (cupin superfamily)